MPDTKIPGAGRKRPQLNVSVEQLHLDNKNPRLPEEAQGKKEPAVLSVLYEKFYLDELADSMAKNGYFDEEPVVAIPQKLPSDLKNADPNSAKFRAFIEKKSTQFTVVEGNRRLATIKILLTPDFRTKLNIRSWPHISKTIADDLSIIPAIIYRKRSEVIPYLGVRHIIGIQKWDSYAKARYIVSLVELGRSIKSVEEQIGDKQGSVTRNYVSYKLLGQAKDEFDIDVKKAREDFSLLLLAIGQGNIKRFLGLPKKLSETNTNEPVQSDKLENLKDLISWIFGDGENFPVIKESRDITNILSAVVGSPEAVAYLRTTRDLNGAYDRTDGEEKMVLKYLRTANTKLEVALGIAHRHKTFEVISQVEKCEQTVEALLKTLRESE